MPFAAFAIKRPRRWLGVKQFVRIFTAQLFDGSDAMHSRNNVRCHLLISAVALLTTIGPADRAQSADKSTAPEIPPGLASYVSRPEPKFRWELKREIGLPDARIFDLHFVSQDWQAIVWEHQLQVYVPAGAIPAPTMLLWNQGGIASDGSMAFGLDLARRLKAPVAFLYGIPNQPLFNGKKEDTLIAETFVRYLETGDDSWPLLFPMVKSLVKAMDVLEAFTRKQWEHKLTGFVVSGASKRGWTTWLTAAADTRVVAIAPLVIDTLNMRAQGPYQLKSFGNYSDQIRDYTERGLVPMPDTPEAKKLWTMVDPWIYRSKITIPKLLINGNNDPYWTSDALNLYWDDLPGEKWITYVPNAGHNLEQKFADGSRPSRERAIASLAAFAHSTAHGKSFPRLRWTHADAEGQARLTVASSPAPVAARLWLARAPTRDFRLAQFQDRPLDVVAGQIVADVPRPAEGNVLFFAELDYEVDGLKHQLSTQVRIVESGK
jgi:PhoPQ-activated pathogenicity-related protein